MCLLCKMSITYMNLLRQKDYSSCKFYIDNTNTFLNKKYLKKIKHKRAHSSTLNVTLTEFMPYSLSILKKKILTKRIYIICRRDIISIDSVTILYCR